VSCQCSGPQLGRHGHAESAEYLQHTPLALRASACSTIRRYFALGRVRLSRQLAEDDQSCRPCRYAVSAGVQQISAGDADAVQASDCCLHAASSQCGELPEQCIPKLLVSRQKYAIIHDFLSSPLFSYTDALVILCVMHVQTGGMKCLVEHVKLLTRRGHTVIAVHRSDTAHTAMPPWTDIKPSVDVVCRLHQRLGDVYPASKIDVVVVGIFHQVCTIVSSRQSLHIGSFFLTVIAHPLTGCMQS